MEILPLKLVKSQNLMCTKIFSKISADIYDIISGINHFRFLVYYKFW